MAVIFVTVAIGLTLTPVLVLHLILFNGVQSKAQRSERGTKQDWPRNSSRVNPPPVASPSVALRDAKRLPLRPKYEERCIS
jgi:hypothetical protein